MYKIQNIKTEKYLTRWDGRDPVWGEGIRVYPSFSMAQSDAHRLAELGYRAVVRSAGTQTAELNPARAQ